MAIKNKYFIQAISLMVGGLVPLSFAIATTDVPVPGAFVPIIAVPNIIYKVSQNASVGNGDDGSEPARHELDIFNADVRGALLKTGHYKIVEMENPLSLTFTQLNKDLKNTSENTLENTSDIQFSENLSESVVQIAPLQTKESEVFANKRLKPDYILVGVVANQDSGENIYPLANTNKVTQTYATDILVEYRLIDFASQQLVASFSASGHGSDMKIMTNNNDGRIVHYNYTQVLKEASKDLAANVVAELDIQFKISDKLKQDEIPAVITDIKTYSDD